MRNRSYATLWKKLRTSSVLVIHHPEAGPRLIEAWMQKQVDMRAKCSQNCRQIIVPVKQATSKITRGEFPSRFSPKQEGHTTRNKWFGRCRDISIGVSLGVCTLLLTRTWGCYAVSSTRPNLEKNGHPDIISYPRRGMAPKKAKDRNITNPSFTVSSSSPVGTWTFKKWIGSQNCEDF